MNDKDAGAVKILSSLSEIFSDIEESQGIEEILIKDVLHIIDGIEIGIRMLSNDKK